MKINKYLIWIAAMIILDLRGLYLVEDLSMTRELNMILQILFIVFVYCNCTRPMKRKYSLVGIVPLLLAITSSISAGFSYNQPFSFGFRTQRHLIVAALTFFPLSRLIKAGKVTKESIYTLVDNINIILSVMLIIQYILGPSNLFFHVMTGHRYGSMRLMINITYFLISYFVYITKLTNGERIGIKGWYLILFVWFIEIVVTKSRMSMVAVGAVTLIAFLRMRLTIRKFTIATIAILSIAVFLSTPLGNLVFDSLISTSANDGSIAIRDVGREYFLDELTKEGKTFVLGRGYANIEWEESYNKSGISQLYFFNDHGIFGLMYYYGIIILIWTIYIHLKLFSDTRRTGNLEILFYILAGAIGMATLFPISYSQLINFSLVCAIAEENDDAKCGFSTF